MARLLDLLFAPLAWLARLWPKRRLLLFGAWHGQAYRDNSRDLAEWLAEKRGHGWRVVWSAHSPGAVAAAREAGLEAHHAWSPAGIAAHLGAAAAFVTHGRRDLNRFFLGARLVRLGHGMPIRKVGVSVPPASRLRAALRPLLRALPTHPDNTDLHLASSPVEAGFLAEAYGCRTAVFPQPRVMRAPERRGSGGKELRVLALFTWRPWLPLHDLAAAKALAGTGAEVTVKPHPYWVRRGAFVGSPPPAGVEWVSEPGADPLDLLAGADLLLTDYSSVAVDAADLGVPVAFVRDPEYERRRPLYWDDGHFSAVGIGRWDGLGAFAADLAAGEVRRLIAESPPPASLGQDSPARAGAWPPEGRLADLLAACGL